MSAYLLDTNVFLFSQDEAQLHRLSAAQAAVLTDGSNSFFLSAASIAEMAMLNRKGKFLLPGDFGSTIRQVLEERAIAVLEVRVAHVWHTAQLPIQSNHNDPMDLLILAQAFEEKLPLLSTDGKFPWYVPHGLHLIA